MTRQEEYEMILKIRNKDLGFEHIVQKYDKFLWRKVHQYYIVGQEDDDKYSWALHSLHKAVSTFDNQVKFLTYLGTIIDNDFLGLIRKAQGERNGDVHYHNCIRLNKVISNESGQDTELGSFIPSDVFVQEVRCNEIRRLLESFIASLQEDNRTLLELYLLQNATQVQIAQRMKLSQSVISRRINKLLLELKAELTSHGFVY